MSYVIDGRTSVASPVYPVPEDLIGQTVGNYRLTRCIGSGATGTVWEAIHPILGRRVALKLLSQHDANNQVPSRRFLAEARAVSAIAHKNIVKIFDLGSSPRGFYFTMELLEGESLRQRLMRGRLDLDTAIEIARQMARGLAAAHARGVIHRDLKPENVFLAGGPRECPTVKVLDFSCAKLLGSAWQRRIETEVGTVLGTPYYMAPEQIMGSRSFDPRTDVYALGVLLFEMLTGCLPFQACSFAEVAMKHLAQPPPSVCHSRTELPTWIDDVVRRALSKRPQDRFATMADLWNALARGGESEVVATQPARCPLALQAALAAAVGAAIALTTSLL